MDTDEATAERFSGEPTLLRIMDADFGDANDLVPVSNGVADGIKP